MIPFIKHMARQTSGTFYVIGTILGMAHYRGSYFAWCPDLFSESLKDANQGESYGAIVNTAKLGAFDVSVLGASYGFGFLIGSVEGGLLSLTYPMAKYFWPKTYRYGLRSHHTIFPTYLMANMLYNKLANK